MRILKLSGMILLFACSVSTNAQLFINAAVGNATLDSDFRTDSDIGMRLGLGYDLNDYVSVELNYLTMGEHDLAPSALSALEQELIPLVPDDATLTADAGSLEIRGVEYNVTAAFQAVDKLDVFARIGAFIWDGDAKVRVTVTQGGDVVTQSSSSSFDGEDITYALGAQYHILKNVILGSEYALVETDDAKNMLIAFTLKYYPD